MKQSLMTSVACSFLMISTLAPQSLMAASAEERGLEVAKKMEATTKGFRGESSEMEMVLMNAQGDSTTRKLKARSVETPEGFRALTTFEWPADVKGTRTLIWSHQQKDNEQWIYLPALKRVKRIAANNISSSFMGSEFTYEDLSVQGIEKFTHRLVEESKMVDGKDCWVLEQLPKNGSSGYSKLVSFVDKAMLSPLRIDYYDRKGELLKTATFKNYSKFGKWWRPQSVEMKNVQTKKASTVSWKARQINQNFATGEFESDRLQELN